MRFIIADDSVSSRHELIKCLNELGQIDILEASHGGEAYGMILKGEIDFVITAWSMPVVNGLELAALIRGNDNYSDLPILLVTERATREDVVKAVAAKINNYIVKPVYTEILKEKIDAVLAKIPRKQIVS